MARLSINLVARDEESYLPFLLASLKRQTFKDWELVFVDNASMDKTLEILQKELEGTGIAHKIIKNEKNLGFSEGHNQAFKASSAEYILIQNADMYLMPDALFKMVNFLDIHEKTAAISPRLMRWNFERSKSVKNNGADLISAAQDGFSEKIDSIGIRLFRNRRALEWLTGEEWAKDSANEEVRKIYGKPAREVFGISGAMAMYRKKILEEIKLPGDNLFDPTYHSYKEDLDLSYRLQNAGQLSYVLLDAVAYHDRRSAGPGKLGSIEAIKNKSKQSYFTQYHSYKNHLRTLYKNEYWQNFLIDLPFILSFEIKKFGYLALTSPKIIINGLADIAKHFSYLEESKKAIKNTRRMHWKGIRRWM